MTVTLQTKSGEFKFETAPGEPVLFAGLRAGLTLPYECATGTCGTCRARKISGDCSPGWSEAPGMARFHPDKGDMLMCQAKASGDCLLRVPADVQQRDANTLSPSSIQGRISACRMLTSDVMHVELFLDQPIPFDAGQFMVVGAPGLEGGRAYSMVNHAMETDQLNFVVKRKPDGGFCNWLFDNDVVGSLVTLFGPLGAATFRPEEGFDLLCITGGSGIAGIMSILSHASAIDYFMTHQGQLYFGVRTLADGFYLPELAAMIAKSRENLQVTLALSDEKPSSDRHPDFPDIRLAEGFVHDVAAQSIDGSQENTIGFVAGPAPMVDGAIRVLIANAGLPANRIRYDKFS